MKLHNKQKKVWCCYRGESGGGTVMIFILLIIATGLFYFVAAHHFIMTSEGMKMYPKTSLTLHDSYLDMTQMKLTELRHHEETVNCMIHHGDTQYLPGGEIIVAMTRAGKSMSQAIQRIDSDFHLSDSAHQAARISHNTYNTLENRYNLNEKAQKTRQKLKQNAEKLNTWLKNQ